MAFVWLFSIWFIPSFVLLVFVAILRRRTLLRVGSAGSIVKYLVTSATDHAAFATQGTGLTLLAADVVWRAPSLAAVGAGAVFAFCLAYMALDVALFVQGGLRMQWQFVAFRSALKDFARGKGWAGQAFGIVGASASICAGSAWAFYQLLVTRGQTPDWELIPAIIAAMTLSAWARRTLPVFFMYEWTNPIVVGQVKAYTTLLTRLTRRRYAHRRNARGVPEALIPQCERSTPVDAQYPLLRQLKSFEGPKHFEFRLGHNDKPHVVCLFLESFRAADVGALGAHHDVTPHFDALCDEGILWERFYATGTYTAPALTAAIYGVLPRFSGSSLQMHMPPIALMGLPHVFAKQGYTTAFFSDGPMEWENKREFFLRNGYGFFYGPPSLLEAYPQAKPNLWNFDDAYLMRFHAAWLAEQQAAGKPSFSTLLTVTNHHPFTAPPHAAKPDVGDDVDATSDYYNYLRTTQYTDQCLGAYIQELKERGLYDKTLFVILGDHGQQVTFEHKMDWSGQYNDSGVRIPLLMVAPKRLPKAKIIKELGSQVDLLPTLMDMFGLDGPYHACGTSLQRRCETRQAITLHPWKPGLYVTRFGDFRYVHSLETDVAALYDIARDPKEATNVAAHYPEVFVAQKEQVALLRDYLEALYIKNAVVPFVDGGQPKMPRLPQDAASAPESLVAMEAHLQSLAAQTPPSGPAQERQVLLIATWKLCLAAAWMPPPLRLRCAVLAAHRLHRIHVGELSNAERTELMVLLQRLTTPPAHVSLPKWLKTSVSTYLAHFRG
ncbi:hypothetical protein Q3G72_012426 [Acer saccharum]|nr:hypothetical protein Q3G72_012426 [Acer saccharum]